MILKAHEANRFDAIRGPETSHRVRRLNEIKEDENEVGENQDEQENVQLSVGPSQRADSAVAFHQ